MLGGEAVPFQVKQFEPDLPHGALTALVQDHTPVTHVMQSLTVTATPAHELELVDVAFGGGVLVLLARGNPLLDGLGFGVGFHADTLQKAQHSFGPASRTTGRASLFRNLFYQSDRASS